MEILVWKIRISVLWIFLAVAMSAAMILFIMGPGVVEDIIAGEMEGMEINTVTIFIFALFWIIPLIMAFVVLILRDTLNRYLNAILGLFFAVFYLVDISGHLSRGEGFGGHIIMGIIGIFVALLIFWHAWKWPKAVK